MLAVGAVVVVAGALTLGGGAETPMADLGIPTAKVTQGRLLVSVTESGDIQPEKRTIISNSLSWPVVIQEVVEEGTRVAVGDLIIRFECKELLDAIEAEEIRLTNAESAYLQAKEIVQLNRQAMDNKLLKAQNKVIETEQDLEKFKLQDSPQQIEDARSEITLAEEELAQARDKLEFKRAVNANPQLESPYSQREIESEALAVARLELKLRKAQRTLEVLQVYDLPQELRNKELALQDARLELTRQEIEVRAEQVRVTSDEKAKKREFEMRTEKLAELRKERDLLETRADRPGLIVYDTGGPWWRSNEVTIAVGEKITPRQQLMVIPDMSSLQVETRVYESIVENVRLGVRAVVRLDSRPDASYTGTVTKVAPLPSSQGYWGSNQKVFPLTVRFDELPDDLKPGMTAQVELVLDVLENVTQAPIAAIFTEQEQTYAWKLANGQPVRSVVKIGKMNDTTVEVLEGLAQQDVVLLAQPPQALTDRPGATHERRVDPMVLHAAATTSQPATQPDTQPATQPTTQPETQPTTQPTTAPTDEPVEEPVEEPADEPATAPVGEVTTGEGAVSPSPRMTIRGDLVRAAPVGAPRHLGAPIARLHAAQRHPARRPEDLTGVRA